MTKTGFLVALSAVLLVGCGGGGGGDAAAPASVIDKFVGRWAACDSSTVASARVVLDIAKTGETTANYSYTQTVYNSTNCTGSVAATDNGSGTATATGTKTIGGATVDKFRMVEGNDVDLDVLALQDGQLVTGLTREDGGTVDAEGYPNSLDTSFRLTKQ